MPSGLHLTIRRKEFAAAFGKAAQACPSRSPKPILQNVKLVATDDGVTLSATDLEVGLLHAVHGVTVLSPGSAILPTARVASILSSCKDDEIDLQVDDDQLVIRTRSAKFKLPSEDPDLFPAIPEFPEAGGHHEIAVGDLRTLIRRTIFSTDVESMRYALGGCLLELSDDSAVMVATDGRRLAKMTVPAEAHGGAVAPEKHPVIPVKTLKVMLANLDDDDLTAHVALQGGSATTGATAVIVRSSDRAVTIYSRLVEGRFPRYQDAIMTNPEVRIALDSGALREAVEQASIVTSDESRGVSFLWANGLLTLSSQAADVGSSTVSMPTGHEGMEVVIDFDPRYLLDALKVIDAYQAVTVELIDAKKAANFVTKDGYSVTIMPLTRDR